MQLRNKKKETSQAPKAIAYTGKSRCYLCIRNGTVSFVNTGKQAANSFSPCQKSGPFWYAWYNSALPSGCNYEKEMCVVENRGCVKFFLLQGWLTLM